MICGHRKAALEMSEAACVRVCCEFGCGSRISNGPYDKPNAMILRDISLQLVEESPCSTPIMNNM